MSLLFGELQFAKSSTDNAPAGTELTRDSFVHRREVQLEVGRGKGDGNEHFERSENVETVIPNIRAAKELAKVRCDAIRLRFRLKLATPSRARPSFVHQLEIAR